MATTTVTAADAAPTALTREDLAEINSLAVFLGAISPHYSSHPMLSVITLLSNYTTSKNASLADVADFLGTTPASVQRLLDSALDGTLDSLKLCVQMMSSVLELIPHPYGGNTAVVVVATTFIVLTSLVLITRLYARLTIAGTVKGYDWTMVVAWAMTEVWSFGTIWQALSTNAGAQLYDQSFDDFRAGHLMTMILNATYPCLLFLIKFSILLFYRTLLPTRIRQQTLNFRIFNILIGVTLSLALASALTALFGTIFQCIPIAYWEDPLGATCHVNTAVVYLFTGGANVFTDIITWIIPMPIIWGLVLPVREKLVVMIVLGLGAFACIASAIRLAAVRKGIEITNDSSYGFEKCIWTVVELHLAIICASVPALRALFTRGTKKSTKASATVSLSKASTAVSKKWGSVGSVHSNTPLTSRARWDSVDVNTEITVSVEAEPKTLDAGYSNNV